MTITLAPMVLVSVGVAFIVGTLSGFCIGVLSTRRYWAKFYKHLGNYGGT
jgi:hypothetical protein